MATKKYPESYECPKCGALAKYVIAETDHPYNSDAWVDEVSSGFSAEITFGLNAKVIHVDCPKKKKKKK